MPRMIALLTVLVVASTGWAQTKPGLSPEQKEILRTEEVFRQAKIKRDVKVMEDLLANDFYEMNQYGKGRDKGEFIDLWKSFSIRDLATDDIDVTITGTVAVVRGNQTEWNAEMDVMMFTRVYIKTTKGWQLLSSMQAINPKLAPAR